MSGLNDIVEDLEDLYENAPCGFLSFLDDGVILKINQTLLTWLGLERSDVVKKLKFQDLIPVGEKILFETQVRPLLQVQRSVNEIQFHLITHSKERLPVLTSTKQVNAADGKTQISRMSVFSITDRKKFEAELKLERMKAEAATKAKADFLSMFSHEIRTPLNAVIGVTNLLESTALSPEQAPFMDMLKNSSDNLMNLLNSILDLSKLEAGKAALDKTEFQIRKFADGNVLAWQGLALKKGISVTAEVDGNIPVSAIGDPVKLTQIVSNLLGNAIKFTSNGYVKLKLSLLSVNKAEMKIKFAVEDSGIGISADKLSVIFDEFGQAGTDITTRFGGTGLGLTISQKLAHLFGSIILVESIPGQGSTFSFDVVLPVGDPNAQTHGIERVANQAGALRGLSVLVADDSEDNIMLMKHLFKKWDATLESATNGRDAIEKVKTGNYDVVLMDMHMPIINGYDAAKAIRNLADQKKRDIPIIAFSGSTSFEGHNLVETHLFAAIVGKPFRTVELISKLLPFAPSEPSAR